MGTVLLALGVSAVLNVGLSGVACYLLAGSPLERGRTVHRFRGQGEAVLVIELLEDAAERGDGVRLNWPLDDWAASPIRADRWGQFPTVVLPKPGHRGHGAGVDER